MCFWAFGGVRPGSFVDKWSIQACGHEIFVQEPGRKRGEEFVDNTVDYGKGMGPHAFINHLSRVQFSKNNTVQISCGKDIPNEFMDVTIHFSSDAGNQLSPQPLAGPLLLTMISPSLSPLDALPRRQP
jgi:hypothetical protein